ncbi:MAG: HAMP domain-containing protein [Rhodospirillaceae bacterium]|nr:HAMP domain-containing protein [Rhodospirillaceae bacterium]
MKGWRRAINRVLPRTLLGRSLLIIVTPLILLQVITTWVFYNSHWETVTRRLAAGIAGDIATVIAWMHTVPTPDDYSTIFEVAGRDMNLQVEFRPGAVLPADPAIMRQNLVDRTLAGEIESLIARPFLIDSRSIENYIEISIQLPGGVLSVVAPRRRLFSATTYVFILWMIGSSMALFAIATVFMRQQVRPVRQLAAAADAFGKGQDVPDFHPPVGAAEVKQAAAAFNLMRERIRRQIAQRTEMLAGVSHDLRTPLTRMKLQLAMLDDGPEVAELKADVEEMEKMVEGYLAFARGEGAEQPVYTNLSVLLRDVVAGAVRQGASIALEAEEEMTVPLRRDAFRRCITNLIANAQRYAKTVLVKAGRNGTAIEITIDDDGPGIPPDKREEVFKPFFRLDPSRNPQTGGMGLGLTIARDVIHSHGGELVLGDSPIGGLRAKLRLPV